MYLMFLQANVAPNIPQQDSQEVSFRFTISCLILFCFQGQQGPAAFVGGHQILPLQHLPLLPGVGLNQVSMPLTYYVFRLYIRSKMCPFYSILLFYSIRLTRFWECSQTITLLLRLYCDNYFIIMSVGKCAGICCTWSPARKPGGKFCFI